MNSTGSTKARVESTRLEMEMLALKTRDAILSLPPSDLVAFLWSRLLLHLLNSDSAEPSPSESDEQDAARNSLLFALEYCHAVWSCFLRLESSEKQLSEQAIDSLLETTNKLRESALRYAALSTQQNEEAVEFGPATSRLEFYAKTAWILIRGNRYQVLEEEFFSYVLQPHDSILRSLYGVGAVEVAKGIQRIADAHREGFGRASEVIWAGMTATDRLSASEDLDPAAALARYNATEPEAFAAVTEAIDDLLRGGICNATRHSKLPELLLRDLAYQRGENQEFFAPGPFSGTPLGTLPARIKPLIELEEGFYAPDGQHVRDASYRAIQRAVIARAPEYKNGWDRAQKSVSEEAFHKILSRQLHGAETLTEVHYRDPLSGNWTEIDSLTLIDDVLIHVEAKAGQVTLHSPATHFAKHARSVQQLIVNAYKQARRFFDYLASEVEVPIFALSSDRYKKIRTLCLKNFRLAIPIGLTVESFSPFSAMAKEIPDVAPLLGQHPFVSMSIDDLFVVDRLLQNGGELLHYLEVRQKVAALRGAFLFDELDHLGAYLTKNRFDLDLQDQLSKVPTVAWDRFSRPVDVYFSGDTWQSEGPPRQVFPEPLDCILTLIDRARTPHWTSVNGTIRDLGEQERRDLASNLLDLQRSLRRHPYRWLATGGGPVRTLLIWLYRAGREPYTAAMRSQAATVALSLGRAFCDVLWVEAEPDKPPRAAGTLRVERPSPLASNYVELLNNARRVKARTFSAGSTLPVPAAPKRNDECPCGSGKKFKKCHGR